LKPLRHILTGKDMLLYHASEFTREKRKCPAFSATHLVAHRVGFSLAYIGAQLKRESTYRQSKLPLLSAEATPVYREN